MIIIVITIIVMIFITIVLIEIMVLCEVAPSRSGNDRVLLSLTIQPHNVKASTRYT